MRETNSLLKSLPIRDLARDFVTSAILVLLNRAWSGRLETDQEWIDYR